MRSYYDDPFQDENWVRVPVALFRDGTWAQLLPGEAKVLGAIWGLADGYSLTTFAGLQIIAEKAGLSLDWTSKMLTNLKKKGLIARWQQPYRGYVPFFTKFRPTACFQELAEP